MWIDYAVNNIWVLLENLFIIDDKGISITKDEDLKEVALKELHNVLSKINETLKFQTFLVSTNFTLADLIFASSLKPIYEKIIDEEMEKIKEELETQHLNELQKISNEKYEGAKEEERERIKKEIMKLIGVTALVLDRISKEPKYCMPKHIATYIDGTVLYNRDEIMEWLPYAKRIMCIYEKT